MLVRYPRVRPWNSRKSLGFILMVMDFLDLHAMIAFLNGIALIHVIRLSDYPQETMISRMKGSYFEVTPLTICNALVSSAR